jgi:hypothetical protein
MCTKLMVEWLAVRKSGEALFHELWTGQTLIGFGVCLWPMQQQALEQVCEVYVVKNHHKSQKTHSTNEDERPAELVFRALLSNDPGDVLPE